MNTFQVNSRLRQNQFFFLVYFGLSLWFTWLFVFVSPLYISQKQMMLSTAVAGGKWGIQIVLAFVFLGKAAWAYARRLGFVCFIGSCILLPFVFLADWGIASGPSFFIGSLACAVAVMIFFYYRAVRLSNLPVYWWLFWLACLAIAISLQLTVVFRVIRF